MAHPPPTHSPGATLKPGRRAHLIDFAHLHFLVLLWGTTAVLGTLISLESSQVVLWRTGLAAAGMWLLLGRRTLSDPLGPTERNLQLATGVAIALHWWLFFLAARVGNVASCLAGISTGSVWAALLEPAMSGRRPRALDLATALVVMVGLLMSLEGAADKWPGVVIGVVSAGFSALFAILNRRSVLRGARPDTVATYAMTGAFAATWALVPVSAWIVGEPVALAVPQGYDWLWLSILVGGCTIYAFTASVWLLRRFTAFDSTLAVNLEPVYGILLAWAVFGERERMATSFYLGAGLILLAVLGYPLIEALRARRARPEAGLPL